MAQPPVDNLEPTAPASPTAADKAQLEIDKLKLEVAKLGREVTAVGRVATFFLPMLIPTLTALVACIGIGVSIRTMMDQHQFQKVDSHNKALQTAIDMATEDRGQADRRIGGINQLRPFWAFKTDAQLLAATLTAILTLPGTTEEAARARCAAADVIGAFPGIKPNPDDEEDAAAHNFRIKELLYGPKEWSSRPTGAITRQNYLLRRSIDANPAAAAEMRKRDSAIGNLNCETPLSATREAIRKGWRDLRNVNLQDTDLAYALFYEADLSGAFMSGATLTGASFRCANLSDVTVIDFDEGYNPELILANIHGIKDDSKAFVDFANKHGAIDLSDDDWAKWKGSEFSGDVLRTLLGPGPLGGAPHVTNDVQHFCLDEISNRGR